MQTSNQKCYFRFLRKYCQKYFVMMQLLRKAEKATASLSHRVQSLQKLLLGKALEKKYRIRFNVSIFEVSFKESITAAFENFSSVLK